MAILHSLLAHGLAGLVGRGSQWAGIGGGFGRCSGCVVSDSVTQESPDADGSESHPTRGSTPPGGSYDQGPGDLGLVTSPEFV